MINSIFLLRKNTQEYFASNNLEHSTGFKAGARFMRMILAIAILPILCNPIIAMDQPDRLRIIDESHAQIIRAVKSDSLLLFNQLAANYRGSLQDIRENGHSLLHIAAMHNAVNMVQHLVQERGFNPKQPNSAQEFAIDLAKRRGNLRIVDYLAQALTLQEKKQAAQAAAQTEDELFEQLAEDMVRELQIIEQNKKSTCAICFDDKSNFDFCTLSCNHKAAQHASMRC